ncbi:hypothetical protein F5148DRAFT_771886 [Russula earlei]|uniref:Uncharacterized protein n=1 Tax=Russula earlei TaxID=71964 RepID=A0ACC0UD77_9AGAM|nr:hypothetical protein F5148DRAFT_771886 [Russula earlei]
MSARRNKEEQRASMSMHVITRWLTLRLSRFAASLASLFVICVGGARRVPGVVRRGEGSWLASGVPGRVTWSISFPMMFLIEGEVETSSGSRTRSALCAAPTTTTIHTLMWLILMLLSPPFPYHLHLSHQSREDASVDADAVVPPSLAACFSPWHRHISLLRAVFFARARGFFS